MRYEGQRPSGKDKDVPVFMFSVGKQELAIIMAAIVNALKNTPQWTETTTTTSRLRNILKNLNKPK